MDPPSRVGTARPGSTIVRPPSARPTTAASVRDSSYGNWIVAVIEGRGVAREVGIAALDRDSGNVVLIQLADVQTYVKTLHHVQLYRPAIILVPDTFVSAESKSHRKPPSLLIESLREEFDDVPFEIIARKYWNDSAGLEFINQLIVADEECPGTLQSVMGKYFVLSACSALFKFADSKLNVIYADNSLRIRYRAVEGTMLIDGGTVTNLELVNNKLNRKSKHSLYGLLNQCHTPMASRLLRVSILAPVTNQGVIDARLDAVEEILRNDDKYNAIKDALRSMKKIDVDKLMASLVASESRPTKTTQMASARIGQMLDLRSILRSLPAIRSALEGCRSGLLGAIIDMVSDERMERIDRLISEGLNEDAQLSKGGGLAAMNARVYAVKANCDRLLDVARETYKENVDDILQLTQNLAAEHDLPYVPIFNTSGAGLGFWLTVRKDDAAELRKGCIEVTGKGAKWRFTTLELKKRNARLRDSLSDALMMSDRFIQDMVSQIIEDIGALYKASEAIALLDMIWSLAHVALLRGYLRPEFTGTLAIKAGRHPVLENVLAAGVFVPNDTYAADDSTFQLIYGPNMSGKSTYLRQIGVLTVMAMVGSFVPAEYASFRVQDALLSRLSNDDDPERSLSTFATEMAAMAMILSLATDRSLLLVDELGRGTSTHDGLGISHAIAEELIRRRSFTFYSSHFMELSASLSRYPTVVSLHLAVQTNPRAKGFKLKYQYRILDGEGQVIPHYGLELAALADLPADVLEEARRVATALQEKETERRARSRATQLDLRRKAVIALKTQLIQAYEHSTLSNADLKVYLEKLQKEVKLVLSQTEED